MIRNKSPEWYEARRLGITSTDIPALLGVDRYQSEGDVAREKMSGSSDEPDERRARMYRLGLLLENVIKSEDEYEHGIKLRRVSHLISHPTIPWALTSLDFERIGERTIVEIKTSGSSEWKEGMPERVEAQVRWQMGVARYPRAHVAVLRYGRDLACFDLEHEQGTFDNLIAIASDFRARLDAGGPFSESKSSMRRAYPYDDGTEVIADSETIDAVRRLLATRRNKAQVLEVEEALETAIKTKMGPATTLVGPGFRATWHRGRERHEPQWRLVAEGLRTRVTPEEWEALIELQTIIKEGTRPFILRESDE